MKIIGNIIGFVVLVFWAERTVASAEVPYNPEPWYTSPAGDKAHAFYAADKSDVFEVIESLQAEAQTALETVPVVPLTRSQTDRYTGGGTGDDKKHYFLVRAVACGGGNFEAFTAGTELGVFHGSLGGTGWIRRRAVVVALKFTPTALYSWCLSAQ